MIVSLSIERAGDDPLVITNDPTGDLWIETVLEPGFEYRYDYAPSSIHMPGQQLLAAVLEQSTLAVVVYARGSSTADLRSIKNTLAGAVSQFAYDVTLTVDGDAQTFAADPTWPQWSQDSGMAEVFMASVSLSIRVNPAGV